MARVFSHPLARAARVWRAERPDGSEQRVLVVVTTLELDPNNNRYKAKLVEELKRAAKEHLEQSSEAASFVIMNPLSQWRGG
jgi:hypothetical protein